MTQDGFRADMIDQNECKSPLFVTLVKVVSITKLVTTEVVRLCAVNTVRDSIDKLRCTILRSDGQNTPEVYGQSSSECIHPT